MRPIPSSAKARRWMDHATLMHGQVIQAPMDATRREKGWGCSRGVPPDREKGTVRQEGADRKWGALYGSPLWRRRGLRAKARGHLFALAPYQGDRGWQSSDGDRCSVTPDAHTGAAARPVDRRGLAPYAQQCAVLAERQGRSVGAVTRRCPAAGRSAQGSVVRVLCP